MGCHTEYLKTSFDLLLSFLIILSSFASASPLRDVNVDLVWARRVLLGISLHIFVSLMPLQSQKNGFYIFLALYLTERSSSYSALTILAYVL